MERSCTKYMYVNSVSHRMYRVLLKIYQQGMISFQLRNSDYSGGQVRVTMSTTVIALMLATARLSPSVLGLSGDGC